MADDKHCRWFSGSADDNFISVVRRAAGLEPGYVGEQYRARSSVVNERSCGTFARLARQLANERQLMLLLANIDRLDAVELSAVLVCFELSNSPAEVDALILEMTEQPRSFIELCKVPPVRRQRLVLRRLFVCRARSGQ